jgi:hypothetical protein
VNEEKKDTADTRLARLKAEFLADFRADAAWRKERREASDFYDGKQWTEDEKQALERRGQPVVTINKIATKFDGIFGIQKALRVDTKAFPKGNRQQEVEQLSEKLRAVEDDNDFDEEESLVFEDIVIDGRGWYELEKEYDGFECRQRVRRGEFDEWLKHRYSKKPDLSDARHVHKHVWMDADTAKQMFPGNDAAIDTAIAAKGGEIDPAEGEVNRITSPDMYQGGERSGGDDAAAQAFGTFVDPKQRRVRVITTFYREHLVERFYMAPGMDKPVKLGDEKEAAAAKESFPNGFEYVQVRKRLHSVTFLWGAILEEKKDLRGHDPEATFPAVMVPGYIERNTKQHYGMSRRVIDPQREYNKRRSKFLHQLNTVRVIAPKGTFDDPDGAREQAARPDCWLEPNPGFEQGFQIMPNSEPAAGQFQLMQQSAQEFDAAGTSREVEGRSNANSGRDFQLRQQAAAQTVRKLIGNLRAARRRVAQYQLQDFIRENPDLGVTKYDIVIEEAKDSLSLESETFEQLVSLATSGIPIPPDMLIEVSPLPKKMKDQFKERMAQQMAAQQQAAAMAAQGGVAPQ